MSHLTLVPKMYRMWMVVVFLLIGSAQIAIAQESVRITGTYSDMYYNKEGVMYLARKSESLQRPLAIKECCNLPRVCQAT